MRTKACSFFRNLFIAIYNKFKNLLFWSAAGVIGYYAGTFANRDTGCYGAFTLLIFKAIDAAITENIPNAEILRR